MHRSLAMKVLLSPSLLVILLNLKAAKSFIITTGPNTAFLKKWEAHSSTCTRSQTTKAPTDSKLLSAVSSDVQTKKVATDGAANKRVYLFHEGNKSMKNLLGGKGANLAEMSSLGLPVPPGFIITTQVCYFCGYRSAVQFNFIIK